MKKLYIVFTFICVLLVACSQDRNFSVWVDSTTQSQETIDSAIERLTNAGVDFIIDDTGSVLVNEKEIDKAVMCCS